MNPEENQPNDVTPGAAPATTPAPETASPDLDQLAADLANVSSADLAAESTPATDAPKTLEMPAELVSDQPATAAEAPVEAPAEAPAEAPTETPSTEPQSTGGSVTLEPSSDLAAAGSPGIATVPTDANQATVPDPIAEAPVAPEAPAEAPAAETTAASSAETLNALDQESNNANIDSTEEENSETTQKTVNENDPIEPAKPVPGSIGSALAYDESAPNNAVPVAKPKPSPEQAKSRNTIIAAVVGGAVLIIGVIVAIVALTNKPKTNLEQPTSNSGSTASDLDSIACSREIDELELEKYAVGDLAPSYGEEKFVATYDGDEMFDAAHTIAVTYDSRAVLERAKSVIEKVYKDKLEELDITKDPFESEYQTSGDVAMAYHYTTLDKLTEKNAELLGIGTSSEGVASSLKNIRSTFRQNGFECTVKAN